MIAKIPPAHLVPGQTVLIGRGTVPEHINRRRTVESVVWWRDAYRVEFTDGTTRYYQPNRSVEVEE